MIFFDWLNLTFDSEREGMSKCGGRLRSAVCITPVASSRSEPSVFLSRSESLTGAAGLAGGRACFLAMAVLCRGGLPLELRQNFTLPARGNLANRGIVALNLLL